MYNIPTIQLMRILETTTALAYLIAPDALPELLKTLDLPKDIQTILTRASQSSQTIPTDPLVQDSAKYMTLDQLGQRLKK